MSATRYRILAASIVVAVVASGIFLFAEKAGNHDSDNIPAATTDTLATSSIPISETISGVTATGDFKVEAIPQVTLPPTPDFRAPIAFSTDVPADVRAHIEAAANVYIARIAKNIGDFRSWIDLGTAHKMGGDFKQAEILWQFVAKAAPNNAVAYSNLGDLYSNFLKDNQKAEANFLAAIKADSSNAGPYSSLFSLYSVYKKNSTAAEDVLKKGISANPQALELQVMLARYYRDNGRAAQAQAAYGAAISAADSAGNAQLSADLKAERDTMTP